MINHSPAQLIAELRRLMDMDYERLPGARHVLEEAIAVIRPLAEKSESPVGEMIDPLRALVAQWRANAERALRDANAHDGDSAGNSFAFLKERRVWTEAADQLDALLSAPVGSPPPLEDEREEVVTCAHCYGNEGRLGYCWACYHELQDSYQRKHAEWVALLKASAPRGGGETR